MRFTCPTRAGCRRRSGKRSSGTPSGRSREALSRQNECYTYFKITGDFDPDRVSAALGLVPERQWRIGDRRRNGTVYDFALWEFGRCAEYDVFVENQMLRTIAPLLPKADILRELGQSPGVSLTLEVVPTVYAGETAPCLSPPPQVIAFCHQTGTALDIDLYVCD